MSLRILRIETESVIRTEKQEGTAGSDGIPTGISRRNFHELDRYVGTAFRTNIRYRSFLEGNEGRNWSIGARGSDIGLTYVRGSNEATYVRSTLLLFDKSRENK